MSGEAGSADVLAVPPDAVFTACEAEIPATHYRLNRVVAMSQRQRGPRRTRLPATRISACL